MEIEVKYYFIDSGELIKKTKNSFTNDADSLIFLKELEQNKMQVIADKLNKGIYKPSLILKNAKSQYDISFRYNKNDWKTRFNESFKAVDKKPLYNDFVKSNNIKILVNINSLT